MGTALARGHGFRQSFTEHGMIIGLVSVRADLTYQQGLRKMWSRSTRYDFYFPAFAMLGEQAILQKEIYLTGPGGAGDNNVFGYQERWASTGITRQRLPVCSVQRLRERLMRGILHSGLRRRPC